MGRVRGTAQLRETLPLSLPKPVNEDKSLRGSRCAPSPRGDVPAWQAGEGSGQSGAGVGWESGDSRRDAGFPPLPIPRVSVGMPNSLSTPCMLRGWEGMRAVPGVAQLCCGASGMSPSLLLLGSSTFQPGAAPHGAAPAPRPPPAHRSLTMLCLNGLSLPWLRNPLFLPCAAGMGGHCLCEWDRAAVACRVEGAWLSLPFTQNP